MNRYRWIVLSLLLSIGSVWAGLLPFQVTDDTGVPVNQDSVMLYDMVIHSDSTGELVWNFRLGASPTQDLTQWVGFPGADVIYLKGNEDVVPTSMIAKVRLPNTSRSESIRLYQIEFPSDKITLLSLETITPSPWVKETEAGIGEYENWTATVRLTDASRWAGLVDRCKISLNLPGDLKSLWVDNPKGFQITSVPNYAQVDSGTIQWEFRNWEPDKDVKVQVSAYRPLSKELDILNPPAFMLNEPYVGDKVAYGDSVLNGYMWMPQFNDLSTGAERGVFARAYLWVKQNEILARHGFEFPGEPELRAYFEKQSWYHPDASFKAEMLSRIEMKNFWKLINRRSEFKAPNPSDKR
jgi:hypothetical protein